VSCGSESSVAESVAEVIMCVLGHIPALSCAPDLRVADCLSMILRQMFPHAFEGTLHVHAATNAIGGILSLQY